MIKKAMPVAIFFVIITAIGILSKSIYFNSLPLAVTTDIVTDAPIRYEYTATGAVQEITLHPTTLMVSLSLTNNGLLRSAM